MIVGNKLARNCRANVTGETVLLDLLDAVIDRAADILERIGMEVDRVSHDIFEPEAAAEPLSYKDILKAIGGKGDLTSKVRESLVSIGRLLCCSWPTKPRACAGTRTCACSCRRCSATCSRCRITPPI